MKGAEDTTIGKLFKMGSRFQIVLMMLIIANIKKNTKTNHACPFIKRLRFLRTS